MNHIDLVLFCDTNDVVDREVRCHRRKALAHFIRKVGLFLLVDCIEVMHRKLRLTHNWAWLLQCPSLMGAIVFAEHTL